MLRLLSLSCALVLTAGCGPKNAPSSTTPEPAPTAVPDPAVDFGLFDGNDGTPVELPQFVASVADTDFVAFGELHEHPVGSRFELELLTAMADQERPVALAMEFFESDTQPALDQYLAGEIDEASFREQTHRNAAYETSHRPLIELCKQRKIPVIAANAPRRLVTAYRKSKQPYPEYLASLPETDRALLPRKSELDDEAFERRFLDFMGPKRGPAFLPGMVLWNDAMAESMADFRAEHPEHRVLLVVGSFHVAAGLGTVVSYRARRPDDEVRIFTMIPQQGPEAALEPDDEGEGDVVLKVWVPGR